jgi:hypothetical protein
MFFFHGGLQVWSRGGRDAAGYGRQDARRYTAIRPDRRAPRDFPNEHRTFNSAIARAGIQRRTSKFSCVGHLDVGRWVLNVFGCKVMAWRDVVGFMPG